MASRSALKVTHGERVMDPSTGATKLDVVRYYAQVAPWAMPHLSGRPVYIRRAPEGIARPMVFLQHPNIHGLRGTDPALWPGHDPAIAIDSAEDLAGAAQAGMLELHTWNSTARAIDKPDRIVFDLDPGEGLAWNRLREGAQLLRALLEEAGLQSWVKTTGGKGLHLFVPVRPHFGYDAVKAFSRKVVQHIANALPDRFVSKSGPRNRRGRIFIDFLRNGWVQSTAEAYSVRARPGLGVSMPLAWGELASVQSGDHWNIGNAIARLESLGHDPWRGYFEAQQPLAAALRRFE